MSLDFLIKQKLILIAKVGKMPCEILLTFDGVNMSIEKFMVFIGRGREGKRNSMRIVS